MGLIVDGVERHTYLIDIVVPTLSDDPLPVTQVQMYTYAVSAPNAEEAMRIFMEEERGEIVYEGEPTDAITIGIQLKNA